MENASAHLVIKADADSHSVLDQARDILQRGHGIEHATLQVEPADHKGCDEVRW
jgi:cobalt-zinc-cadmium efflux system protein